MKRVLFITYYFPPSGGSGVQRGLKMVKYLPQNGWEPIALTLDPDHAAYPNLDEALLDDVPKGTRVIRTRSRDPYALYAAWTGRSRSESVGVGFIGANQSSAKERIARWIRANLFLPDARVGWAPFARRAGQQEFDARGFDAIVSTGPPHTAHLIGHRLARSCGVPWIADIRDAWPDPAYAEMLPTSGWAARRDKRQRNDVLSAASHRVAVTDEVARDMESAVGAPFTVIRNGFDPEDMSAPAQRTSERFTLVHVGNMSPARDPEPLWHVLANGTDWSDIRIVCVGNVDPGILAEAERLGVSSHIDLIPYVPHDQAVSYMKGADMLLLPVNRVENATGIVTGKIYEYLGVGRPILGLGEPDGEAARIISDTHAGMMFDYEDTRGLERFLEDSLAAWRAGSLRPGADPAAAQRFSRAEQARELAQLLDSVTEAAGPTPS